MTGNAVMSVLSGVVALIGLAGLIVTGVKQKEFKTRKSLLIFAIIFTAMFTFFITVLIARLTLEG